MNSAAETSKLNQWEKMLRRIGFPLILLLWPLIAVNEGVNVADTTYSLGNFRYLGNGTGSTWFFATFLANELGKLFSLLPGGNTMLGMNVYTGLIVSVTALAVYFVLQRALPENFGGKNVTYLFCGEFIAESYCWCPTVILYNYLTYCLITLCGLFLILAVHAELQSSQEENRSVDTVSKQGPADSNGAKISGIMVADRRFMLAGVCLGLNVLVRLSNLPEAMLILAVWFVLILEHRTIPEIARKTGFCILGYVIGFGVGWLLSAVQYGPFAYFKAIPETLAISSSASDYSAFSMVRDILNAYITSCGWMLYLAAGVAAGFVFFMIPFVKKHAKAGMVLYGIGLCLLLRLYWGHGMFTLNYQDYWCMFQWGMFAVILSITFDVFAILGIPGRNSADRFLGALSLLFIVIIPIGSNNYTFPLLNCLFLIMPITLYLFTECVREVGTHRDLAAGKKEGRKLPENVKNLSGQKLCHFSWQAAAILILAAATLQGGLFHVNFAFGDGTDGTARSEEISSIPYLNGMHTTPGNAQELTSLYSYLADAGFLNRTLLSYGDAPGLNVMLGMEPAIDTTWPDLASYSLDAYRNQLTDLSERGSEDPSAYPVVILHKLTAAGQASEDKNNLTDEFLDRNGYVSCYENDGYVVYTRE